MTGEGGGAWCVVRGVISETGFKYFNLIILCCLHDRQAIVSGDLLCVVTCVLYLCVVRGVSETGFKVVRA